MPCPDVQNLTPSKLRGCRFKIRSALTIEFPKVINYIMEGLFEDVLFLEAAEPRGRGRDRADNGRGAGRAKTSTKPCFQFRDTGHCDRDNCRYSHELVEGKVEKSNVATEFAFLSPALARSPLRPLSQLARNHAPGEHDGSERC